MARKSTVQHGSRGGRGSGQAPLRRLDGQAPFRRASYEPDAGDAWAEEDDRGRAARRRPGWSGGGGRWLVWIGRTILWAVLIVILINGVTALVARYTESPSAPVGQIVQPEAGFPTVAGTAFAEQFAAAYLNFDSTRPAEREARLAPFLPAGADRQFGWDGTGKLVAGAFEAYDVDVRDAKNAVITIVVQSASQRYLLSVPVHYSGTGFVVADRPGLLPAPAVAALPQQEDVDRDVATESELTGQLDGFFRAYGGTDAVALQRYLAQGVSLKGFEGALELDRLQQVVVPVGGPTREINATVVWRVRGAGTTSGGAGQGTSKLTQSYRLTVEQQGDKWFVKDIRGTSRSAG
ncbi:conjugal transfer protein [Rhizohabitans arisaemae]|uniref:conjugal transfer protein n=1 Tax=Rhizohabitans arisaemae TaxID=2720610 RepID=UPI0024B24A1C|nr:conjugal transfer protein [Rhizohabitans arisaemae]